VLGHSHVEQHAPPTFEDLWLGLVWERREPSVARVRADATAVSASRASSTTARVLAIVSLKFDGENVYLEPAVVTAASGNKQQ
jgi:hypothetical protein